MFTAISYQTMILFKIEFLLICTLTRFVTVITMKLVDLPDLHKNTQEIYKALTTILSKCYYDNLNPLILSHVMNEQIRHYSNLSYSMSFILMDENFDHVVSQAQWTNYYPNAPTFVLIVPDDNSIFYKIMGHIYYSVWGETQPNLILVDLISCQKVSSHFYTLWPGKYLSGILLCYDQNYGVLLYTYNPFTDRAPYPWVKASRQKPWTNYIRRYQEDETVCLNLIFDKTKYLDGFNMTMYIWVIIDGTLSEERESYGEEFLLEKADHFPAQFFINLFRLMNANPIIYIKKKGPISSYDIIGNPVVLSKPKRTSFHSYPFRQASFVIMTHKRSFLSIGDKIKSLYDISVIISIIISLVTLFIALMLNKKQSYLSALMEIMRLLVATGFLQPLDRLPLRIYLFGIFWLSIIISATFTGKLLEFLTKPQRDNVESLADVKKFNYKILSATATLKALNLTITELQIPDEKIFKLQKTDIDWNDTHLAMIMGMEESYKAGFKYNLHVSKPVLANWGVTAMALPIVDRVNEISSRYVESGLHDFWRMVDMDQYKTNLTNTEIKETAPQLRPLAISDVLFMFEFLAVSQGISFIVFLIEVAVKRKHKKNRTKCKRIVVVPLKEVTHTKDGGHKIVTKL